MSCEKSAGGGEFDFPLRFRVQEGFRIPCPLLSAISWFPLPPPPSRSPVDGREDSRWASAKSARHGAGRFRATIKGGRRRGAPLIFSAGFEFSSKNGENRQTMPLAAFSVKKRVSSFSVDQRAGGGGGPSRGVIGQRISGGREAGEGGGA